jgi:hypothetical protein
MDKNKKDKKKYTGYSIHYRRFPGDCSEEQLAILDKFRGYVSTLSEGHPNPKWNDDYLLRFLRARKFHMKET